MSSPRSSTADEPAVGVVGSTDEERSGALRPAWAEIDLDALAGNLGVLTARAGGAGVLAVIKADAYGHGAPRVARALEAAGVAWLGTALLEEGVEVRRAGVETPILVLGVPQEHQLPFYRRFRLTPAVSGIDQVRVWNEGLASEGERVVQPVHLQIDTGMARLGVPYEETGEALRRIREAPHLELAGFCSHFADADDPASDFTRRQEERFEAALGLLTDEERRRVVVHLANSAGLLHHPESRYDLVRCGLALYGHDPAARGDGEADGDRTDRLEPVMSVKARVVQLRELPAGARVGYGGRWTAPGPSTVGIVPVGYADGYSWRLSNRAEALVRGRRVPVVGSVSMDMTHVDLTALEESRGGGGTLGLGEEVVLLGRQGAGRITAVELAGRAGTMPYELLCLLGLRLTRRYVARDAAAEVVSRFDAEHV